MANTARKVLILDGLGCASCASEIEREVGALPGVTCAAVNFAAGKLTIETDSRDEMDSIVQKAAAIARRIEKGVTVLEKERDRHADAAVDRKKIAVILASAALFIVALAVELPFWIGFGICLAAYLLVGGEILVKAGSNLIKGRVFDENLLMSVATLGAFAIGEFPEGVAVMLFYQIGEFFQDLAVHRSRSSIAALMDIRPDYANLKTDDGEKRVSPEAVCVGDIILIRPGEKVPLDGTVTEGRSALDMSALTGEAAPRDVWPGSGILSGSVNKNGLLAVRVTKEFGESTVSKILDLVQNASSKKAPTENFITKFARYYTPAVVLIAVLLALIPPLLLPGADFREWLGRALVFLVVSCPCALVISIPLSFFGGIGAASKNGILVKGSNYLEALNSVDTVVFDKTGTLTRGVFEVTKVHNAEGTAGLDLLDYAAHAESWSTHPIALSILKAWGREPDKSAVSAVEELPGYGIKADVRGRRVLAGTARLLEREQVSFDKAAEDGTIVYIALDGQFAGYIVISDRIKDDSKEAVAALRELGVRKLVMLTGDRRTVGEQLGRELGLDAVFSELLPYQKVEELEKLDALKPVGGRLVYAGDGINDAPVLARADVGVAMGGAGSDAAIEAADIVIMTDEPSKLAAAIKIARRTRQIVWQNIIFAMAVKVLVLALGAGGLASIWHAVFADVGVALIAVLNAMRVLKSHRCM
jgi:Cd2+/Zn2+-exporting ATPase